MIEWHTGFALPNQAGRLHVTIRNGVLRPDDRPLLVIDLTARGLSADTTSEGMWSWFDLAHEWIVRGFTDLTSSFMHEDRLFRLSRGNPYILGRHAHPNKR